MNTRSGMLGRKVGMTQIFLENGDVAPVTILEVGGNVVVQRKTADSADGYEAVQLGLDTKKPSRATRAEQGHAQRAGLTPQKLMREIRLGEDAPEAYSQPGATLKIADIFSQGDVVDVTGTSKGRGFTGVMKRYHFAGFESTHGTHEFFRHGGSIGCRLTPGMVLKGKKMPGQMGNQRVTVQNLKVARIDEEKNLIYVSGGVPGPNGGYLMIRKAIRTRS